LKAECVSFPTIFSASCTCIAGLRPFYLLPDFRVVGFRKPTRQGIHLLPRRFVFIDNTCRQFWRRTMAVMHNLLLLRAQPLNLLRCLSEPLSFLDVGVEVGEIWIERRTRCSRTGSVV
jgi:hypothetical protein